MLQVIVAPSGCDILALPRPDTLIIQLPDDSVRSTLGVAEALHTCADGQKDVFMLFAEKFHSAQNLLSQDKEVPLLQSTLRKLLIPSPSPRFTGLYEY